MVLRERIELSTSPLPRECSTTELPQRLGGPGPAGAGSRRALPGVMGATHSGKAQFAASALASLSRGIVKPNGSSMV